MGSGDPPGLQNRRFVASRYEGCVRLAHASATFLKTQRRDAEARRFKEQFSDIVWRVLLMLGAFVFGFAGLYLLLASFVPILRFKNWSWGHFNGGLALGGVD